MRTKATNEFKKRKKKEAIVLKAMIAIVAVAVLLTVFCAVFKWEWLMPIKQYLENENLRNAVLVFLQIQATIIALVMTVIALLSGIISESYMGISIPNYFLEKKSKWLNGRRILAIDFIAFIIEIVLYIASLYVEELMIVIIAGFAITLITTFWLSSTIYMAFSGKIETNREIEQYVVDQFENSDSYEELGRLFIADWKQNVKYQSVADFKARMFVFMKLISRLIFKEYRVDLANSLSRDMALFLLSDSDENNQLKGIKFMAQFYHGLVNWLCDYEDPWVIDLNEDKIKEKKEIAKKFNEPVALFAKRNRQFEKTVNQLQATRLVDKKEILDLFLDVIKIYSYEGGYKDEVESFDRDADMLLIDSVNLWELWDFTVNHGFTFYASEYEERLFAEKLYYNRIGECFLASAIGSIWHNQLKNTMEKISEFIDQIDGMGGQSFLWARVVSVHCFLYLHSKVNNYYDKNRINKIKEVLQSDTLRKHVKSIWEKYTIKENDGNGKIVEDEKIIQDTIEMVVFDLMSYQISDDIEDHFAIPFSKKVIGYFSYLYSAILGRDFNKTTISFDKFEKHDSSLGVWP